MLNVGLTGGIATGKSTVARVLVEKGARLIDFDELSHTVEEPEGPVWKEIVGHFGEGILHADRTIDRRTLGDIVFADREKLNLLNRLVHPAVFQEWHRRLEAIRKVKPDAIVLSDIPLLIEAGMKPMVDLVLLVYIPPEEQIARLVARNGFSREDAAKRVAAQMPIEEKLPFADIVVRNDGLPEVTQMALSDVWTELIERERQRGEKAD
ncbi:MAG: dephospho-CoA kinase [Deltaproteobacteria bacterium]|nr:dephospho-CoA kinase [Deltaproteobacteria bacterium]